MRTSQLKQTFPTLRSPMQADAPFSWVQLINHFQVGKCHLPNLTAIATNKHRIHRSYNHQFELNSLKKVSTFVKILPTSCWVTSELPLFITGGFPKPKTPPQPSLQPLLDASPEAANCCLGVVHRHGRSPRDFGHARFLPPKLGAENERFWSQNGWFWMLMQQNQHIMFLISIQLFKKKNVCVCLKKCNGGNPQQNGWNVKSRLHTHVHPQRDSDTLLSQE